MAINSTIYNPSFLTPEELEAQRHQDLLGQAFSTPQAQALYSGPQISAQENADIDSQIAAQRQAGFGQQSPNYSAQQYADQITAATNAEAAGQQEAYLAQLNNTGVSPRFQNANQSFMEAVKNPDKAQRSAIKNFGLQLMMSSPTESLSARLGKALGTGSQAMDVQREKQLSREQALSKLNLSALKSKREAAEKAFTTNLQVKGEERSVRGSEIKENAELRAKAGEVRDTENQEIKRNQEVYNKLDRAHKTTVREQLASRGGLSIEQNQTNQSIANARLSIQDAIGNGLTAEQLVIMRQAKVKANDEGISIDDPNFSPQLAAITLAMGGGTIPNEYFNPAFIDNLELASKPLFSAGGKTDYNARTYSDILTLTPGSTEQLPENITSSMVDQTASALKRRNPGMSNAKAKSEAVRKLRSEYKTSPKL